MSRAEFIREYTLQRCIVITGYVGVGHWSKEEAAIVTRGVPADAEQFWEQHHALLETLPADFFADMKAGPR